MVAEPTPSPVEQRVLTALYTTAGLAFMVVLVWQQLDPGGPVEWFERVQTRAHAWRQARRELAETYLEIVHLPETEEPCAP